MTTRVTRRTAMLLGIGTATAGSSCTVQQSVASPERSSRACNRAWENTTWPKGIEGQRRADLQDGTYLNPVLAGDHPDPSVLKDGNLYFKVSSSFDYYPGLVIWRSEDLINWTPLTPTLQEPIGSVYAPDLVKHNSRYYIYFAAANITLEELGRPGPYGNRPFLTNYVIHADVITGPWSEPIDLQIRTIDPGHIVGGDGRRYLFLAGGQRVRLSDDGLKTDGKLEKVYDGWPIPNDWVIEGFNLEGPKLIRRDGWFYMFSAQGGTGGPPTSHMVVVARSRSINGPWENSPRNPLVHTASASEPWWSRGHATPVEGPNGDWWLTYHGYENGFRTLGRQMLLEPMRWVDGWPQAEGGDLAAPLRKPLPQRTAAHGTPLSDDFESDHLGTRLSYFTPDRDYRAKLALTANGLQLTATGKKPNESTLLVLNAGDRHYSVTVEVELLQGATGGLLLFYNRRAFCGLASTDTRLHLYKSGAEFLFLTPGPAVGSKPHLRVVNNENGATFSISPNGSDWRTVCSFEVSGYNHNVYDGFLSLRPAVFAMGMGQVVYKHLKYQAL